MPIYEYECKKCHKNFEQIVSCYDTDAPACPECQSAEVVRLMSAGAVRPNGIPKGSGGFTPPACSGKCGRSIG